MLNAWDGFGRLASTTSKIGGFARTVSHGFDRDGRDTELAFPDGQRFWTARDGLGRPLGIFQGPLGSSAPWMVAFVYNGSSQLYYLARRFGDVSSFAYDGPGRLSAIEDGFAGGVGNTRSAFTYNPAGQLKGETRTNDAYAYTGSAPLNRSYATNGQNQYTATVTNGAPGAAFTYDPNGNLTSDGSTTFTYDAENRLVSASGAKTATLSYDPLGRLFQIWSPTTGVTQFLHDGDELVAEYNASGTMLRRYVHGDGSDDPLFWYEGPGFEQARFPHSNRQGSITATAGPGATPLWINTYDEYGIPGASNQGRFQYTGQAWLPELGMYYYKARIYSARLGRFLQVDPIGYDDQINLYAYVGNDPINITDPSGTQMLRSNPADSDFVSDKKREIRDTITRGLWEAEKKGYWLLATLTSLAFGPEGQIGRWVAVNESMSTAARAFQLGQGGRHGATYLVNGTRFDGRIGRTLIEAKSGLDSFVKNGEFVGWFRGADAMVAQANRQLRAAAGRASIEWRVQGESGATAIRNLFKENGIRGITVRTVKEPCRGTLICHR